MKVYMQYWTESERGWGTRPDGMSLHLTEDDCKKYISVYWSRQPDSAPSEYSRPEGKPIVVQLDGRSSIATEVKHCPNSSISKFGVRYWQHNITNDDKLQALYSNGTDK